MYIHVSFYKARPTRIPSVTVGERSVSIMYEVQHSYDYRQTYVGPLNGPARDLVEHRVWEVAWDGIR
jgi:hypothetical protein